MDGMVKVEHPLSDAVGPELFGVLRARCFAQAAAKRRIIRQSRGRR
jgi:hypothetical protein